MSALTAAVVLAWVAILILALAISGLTRAVGRLATGAVGAPAAHPLIGSQAPPIPALGPWSEPTVMVFVDPTCIVCRERIQDIKEIHSGETNWILVTTDPSETFSDLELNGLRLIRVESPYVTFFGAYSKPFGVVIDSNGLIVAASALGNRKMLTDLVPMGSREGS